MEAVARCVVESWWRVTVEQCRQMKKRKRRETERKTRQGHILTLCEAARSARSRKGCAILRWILDSQAVWQLNYNFYQRPKVLSRWPAAWWSDWLTGLLTGAKVGWLSQWMASWLSVHSLFIFSL